MYVADGSIKLSVIIIFQPTMQYDSYLHLLRYVWDSHGISVMECIKCETQVCIYKD